MKMKFTDRAISNLPPPPPGRKDYWRFDSETQGWGLVHNEAALDNLISSKGFRKCIQMAANAVYLDQDAKV